MKHCPTGSPTYPARRTASPKKTARWCRSSCSEQTSRSTYTVTAPETVGTYSFVGELEDFEKDSYPVGGAADITVADAPPTALRTISETAVVEGESIDVTIIALNYGFAGTLVESLGQGLNTCPAIWPTHLS